MQRLWSGAELGEHWTLRADDLGLPAASPAGGRLGLAAQLAHWRQNGRYPDDEADLAPAVVGHLATQVDVHADVLEGYEGTDRTGRRHRRLVLDHLAVAAFDDAAEAKFRSWLSNELLPREPAPPVFEGEVSGWFARERISRPGGYGLDRILRSASAAHDDAALQRVSVASPTQLVRGDKPQPTRETRRRRFNIGALHATLSCLQKMSYVSSSFCNERSEGGCHRKRCYKIEGAGLEALRRLEAVLNALCELSV